MLKMLCLVFPYTCRPSYPIYMPQNDNPKLLEGLLVVNRDKLIGGLFIMVLKVKQIEQN